MSKGTMPAMPSLNAEQIIVAHITGGVSLPVDTVPNEAYYIAVTERLNVLSPEAFSPPLAILDSMIRSIVITNP